MIEISLIQLKRGTKANLERVLRGDKKPAKGEPIWETDTNTLKLGDGVHNYIDLPYIKAQPTTELQVDDKSIKTLKTDNTDAQTASSSEAISGSGIINLHKIAKTGTYGDLIGTPIPGDSGEIKTKYRCASAGYTGSGDPVWYYKLVKLPVDNSENYASAIINGRIGGWTASGMSAIYCLIWNRDGVGLSLLELGGTGTMSSIFDTVDLVVYKNSDNTADIYIRCKGYFTFDLDVEVYQSTASITYDGTYITTTPSGTESGKASTSTSRLELEKGVLKVNGTAVQSKISALGAATQPVYFSSDGVASACLNYGGGTKVTLNGTECKGTSATLYAPTSAGTSGYSLKSNGSGAPRWADSRSVAISGTVSTGAKACEAASVMITSGGTDHELGKGLWYYVGTYGVFIVFVPSTITTPYSAKTIYITGYVSSQISGTITLVEL